ncbi:response regulator [Ostreiculturibacter nitratireducens]|uniref:response regulator n=1 Tax=Ostreiculturibacter nitratireducens TaxID=3075226 RepID=UPI0031B567B8
MLEDANSGELTIIGFVEAPALSVTKVSGVNAAATIRQSGGPCRNTPIIAVTAHVQKAEVENFLQAGMNGAIAKPISRQKLRELIAGLTAKATRDQSNIANAIDRATAQELVELLGATRTETLLEEITAELAAFAERLEQPADTARDLGALKAEAHRLAGAVAIVGASAVRTILIEAEELLKSEGNEERLTSLAKTASDLWRGAKAQISETVADVGREASKAALALDPAN